MAGPGVMYPPTAGGTPAIPLAGARTPGAYAPVAGILPPVEPHRLAAPLRAGGWQPACGLALAAALLLVVAARAFHTQLVGLLQGLDPGRSSSSSSQESLVPAVAPLEVPAFTAPIEPVDALAPTQEATVFWCNASGTDLPEVWSYDVAGAPIQVKVLTYNLFWFGLHGSKGRSAVIHNSGTPPYDLMGFQECEDAAWILGVAGLAGQYTILANSRHAISMAVRNARWDILARGQAEVAEDSHLQYYGNRSVAWARLRDRASSRTLFFMNHHGPTPVGSGGRCGGAATAHNVLQVMAENADRKDAVILVGDFNADPVSETIKSLTKRLLPSFSFTPHGDVDQIFSNLGPSSVVSTTVLPQGGSDHHALAAVLKVSASGSYTGQPPPGQPVFVGVR